MNTSNVAALSTVFCECNATPAMRNTWSPLAANTAASVPAVRQALRQWVLSVPFPLRFLFASQPKIMGKALGIVYRTLATHLIRKADYTKTEAHAGAVALIQRFGSALNLNIHFQLLLVDDVYFDGVNEIPAQFRWVKAPTSNDRLQ